MEQKNILLLSDSHGNTKALEAVFKWALNQKSGFQTEAAVFLGDGIRDISEASQAAGFSCDWKIVRGNNDFFTKKNIPEAAIFEVFDHRFFLCHGHHYSLYSGYGNLLAAAHSNKAEAVFFGHTHVPHCSMEGDVLLLNPGSTGRPRSMAGATFALLKCMPKTKTEINFFKIENNLEISPLVSA